METIARGLSREHRLRLTGRRPERCSRCRRRTAYWTSDDPAEEQGFCVYCACLPPERPEHTHGDLVVSDS